MKNLSRIIRLKTLNPFFNAQCHGYKNFEIRKFDKPFYIGGIIELVEIAAPKPLREPVETGRTLFLEVTYMLFDFEGIEDGFVILGTKQADI